MKQPENFPNFKGLDSHPQINREYMSISVGSEHYTFCNMRKNNYEEALFKIEDEKFEIDALILLVKRALKLVENWEIEQDVNKKNEVIKKIHKLKILKKTDFVGEGSETIEFIKAKLLEKVKYRYRK